MTFPYPHPTVAEKDKQFGFYMGSKREARFPVSVENIMGRRKDKGATGLQIRSTLPDAPCLNCGARGWCGHGGRIAA